MITSQQPVAYVLAGINGAGKTTFALRYLSEFVRCREFLNADLIAAGLSPFAPETQNLRAGRLLLERINELAESRSDIAFETTLSGRSYLQQIVRLKQVGYRIEMFYLWLPSVELAIERVVNRVKEGGHSVPEATIRRRYRSSISNFVNLYRPVLDRWWLYNALEAPPRLMASAEGERFVVGSPGVYEQILNTGDTVRERPADHTGND